MSKHRIIDSLDSRHLVAIIMFLVDNGPSRRIDIYDGVSRNASMPSKIKALVDLGLVEQRNDDTVFALTSKGMTVAEHLSGIESAIHGNP